MISYEYAKTGRSSERTVVRTSASAGARPRASSKCSFTPSARISASLGIVHWRALMASFGSSAVEPILWPLTSHQPTGAVAVRVLPGSSLPMTISLLSNIGFSLLVAAKRR